MLCHQCGKSIRARAQFCRYCGAPTGKQGSGGKAAPRKTVELRRREPDLPEKVEEAIILPITERLGEEVEPGLERRPEPPEDLSIPPAITSELPFIPEPAHVTPPSPGELPEIEPLEEEEEPAEPREQPRFTVALLLLAVIAIFIFAYLTGQ